MQAIIISLITASLFGTIHPTQEEGRKVIALSAFASMVRALWLHHSLRQLGSLRQKAADRRGVSTLCVVAGKE